MQKQTVGTHLSPSPPEDDLTCQVYSPSGFLGEISLAPTSTVRDLQRSIKSAYGLRIRQQRVVIDGAVAQPSDSLQSLWPDGQSVGEVVVVMVSEACSACGKLGPTRCCGGCRSAFYCNTHCRDTDWPSHRVVCQAFKENQQ